MGAYDPSERLIWSLSGSGLTTTIGAAGNSGGESDVPPADYTTSAVDLGRATDVGLYVYATGKTGSPSVTVSLDVFGAGGQLFAGVLSTAAVAATGAAVPVFGGLHGYGAGTYLVLPHWGRVSWAYTGTGSLSGVEISLYGR